MATVQALIATISSLIGLYILLASWEENSFMQAIGVGGISYGKITTAVYLKVSISDFLTLFSSRAGGDWFWSIRPANILLVGASIALLSSTLIAMFWPESKPDNILTVGLCVNPPEILVLYVWIWSLIWWIVADCLKVFTRYYLYLYCITFFYF